MKSVRNYLFPTAIGLCLWIVGNGIMFSPAKGQEVAQAHPFCIPESGVDSIISCPSSPVNSRCNGDYKETRYTYKDCNGTSNTPDRCEPSQAGGVTDTVGGYCYRHVIDNGIGTFVDTCAEGPPIFDIQGVKTVKWCVTYVTA